MEGRFLLAVLAAILLGNSRAQSTACSGYADVVFVVDSSDSVGQADYQKELDLVKQTVNQMNVGPQGLHVGLVTYGSQSQPVFNLKDPGTAAAISTAIDKAPFVGGGEDILGALNTAKTQMFTPTAGVRDKTSRIVVLVTGGRSTNKALTKLRAEELRANDIDVYSVGIGKGVDVDELNGIASDPDSRYVYTADTFDSAKALAGVLGPKICNEIPEAPQFLPPPTGCLQKADVMFLLDSSSTIGQSNFQKLEDFMKNTVKDLDVGPDKVRVGVMQYSSYPSMEFPLNMHDTRYDVLKAIDQVSFMGGGANTADALQYMRQLGFSQNSGARPDVPRVAIVITDGSSANSAEVVKQAENARRDNIGLIAIGVGPNVNTAELQAIADDPDSAHMFNPQDYASLAGLSKQIINAACSVQATAPPMTTLMPGATLPPDPCQDKVSNCANYPDDVCTNYQAWAQANCPKRCGLCTPLRTTAPPACDDVASDCTSFGIGSCQSYRPYMIKNCKRYCGFCGLDTQSIGFYGNCAYKGMTYSTGQKWTDGCDYECVCEDGNTGKYRCYNRCPLYHNLPAECTLVKDPDSCCLQPQCNFDQKVATTQGVNKGSKNGVDTCVYGSKNYYQDQQWQDGCSSQCVCVDASTGRHECHDLCPSYTRLPSYCQLERKPGQCCATPICEFQNQQGTFTGLGSVSSNGVGQSAATLPPCDNKATNCALYGKSACTQYKQWAQDNCREFCGLCGTGPDPGPDDKCLYDGVQYSQDQFWYVGSDTRCVCENAISGYYRCVNLCPTYTNLPASCTVKQPPTSTCDVVSCTSGTFVSSSNNLGSIGNGGNIVKGSPDTFVPPTRPSGEQAPPGTGGSPDNAPTLQGCLYNGMLYVQGQRWDDGCSKSCECLDALTGNTKCRQRCPDYTQVPSGCTLVADPDDPCCVKPKCADPSVTPVPHFQTYTTNFRPVAPPTDNNRFTGTGGFGGPSGGQATVIQTGTPVPTVPPGTRSTSDIGIGVCNYAGKTYKQNETWKDGCDYNCRCDEASYGHYTCTQICVVYKDIPFPYCRLIQDPNNPCCKIPSCIWTAPVEIFTDFAVVNPTSPGPKVTNAPPAPSSFALCEHKGEYYDRDQVWYDGCDYKCTCEEPATNKYRCDSRCPEFPNTANCKFVRDTKDPTCCEVPVCPTPSPGPNQTPDPTPTPQRGIVTGGVTPGKVPGNKGYCEYNGQTYQQGEIWDDGCEYNCVCEDAVTGKYKCTEKCARYPELAPNCRLIDDFANPCCKVPRCDPVPEYTTVSPGPNSGSTAKPPVQEYCVYNNVQYATGQQWVDGCDKKCQCDNQDTGVYSCTERCITYDNLPAECKLVTDPRDACCRVPQCGTPSPRVTPAPPTVPGGNTQVPGSNGPTPVTRVTNVPTPPSVTGKVTGYANVPTPSPGPGGSTGAPPTRTFCEYKGQRYNQNEKWTDGCQFDCECVQALVGKYECLEKCARYVNLPAGCRLVKDPSNPCCDIPDCPAVPPQQATTTVAPGPGQPGVTTQSPRPGGPTDTAAPPSVCVYKGQQYTQGQKWYDGCDYACECEDAMQGVYRCDNRCPTYNSVPPCCHYESDPRDPFCCKMIRCDIPQTVNNKTGTGLIPTPPPGQKTGGYVTPAPTPFNPNNPTPMAGQPTPSPIPQGVCVYKGRQYQVGSKWQDGCDSNCECLDTTGLYRCTEICPPMISLPPQCTYVTDVNQPCCKTPYCDFTKNTIPPPVKTTTVPPNPFFSPTPSPRTDVCIYNGVAFKQGERWEDGCDLKCVCENAVTGYYRCSQRCAATPRVNPGCTLTTDPRDACCKVPVCPVVPPTNPPNPPTPPSGPTPTGAPDPNNPGKTLPPRTNPPTNPPNPTNPNPYTIPTLPPNKIDGYLVSPSPSPKSPIPDPNKPGNTLPPPTNPSGCLYGGVVYKRGQTWQDGCQYNCVCVDDVTGRYTCSERCSLYLNLPSYCRLINDPNDACCKVPECVPPANPPTTALPPTPGTGPTLPGQPPVTPGSGPTPPRVQTPPTTDYCVYKGVQYSQGQQWNDGCEKVCVCDSAMGNIYRCSDRCPVFKLTPGCTLIPDPNDPTCCEVPQCIQTPGPNEVPTPGPTKVYTNLPTGKVTGQAPVPTKPAVPGQSSQKPPEGCMYKNQRYVQGQRWQDGCDYECVCEDGITGRYSCSQRCPTIGALPPQCKLVQDPNDFCCSVPSCDNSQTPTPGLPPRITLTPTPPGQTPPPGQPPAPTQASFCVYNGVPYRQGQTWKDGCSTTCRCDNADKNYYTCADRCPTYQLQPGCKLVTDPNDVCCQVPQCFATPSPNPTNATRPTPSPTPFPNGTYPQTPRTAPPVSPTPFPFPVPNKPGVIVGTPPPTQRTGFCEFKGRQYKTGDKWVDGCDYNCVCVDMTTGLYKCEQRCAPYPNIPASCVKVQDPNDICCQVPYCPGVPPPVTGPTPPSGTGPTRPPPPSPTGPTSPTPTFFPSIIPPPATTKTPIVGPTPVPQDVCIYNGKAYTQGQTWYVGCDKTCVCEDASTGGYTCTDRCASYKLPPASSGVNCVLVPDMKDPTCCKTPQCDQGNNPNPNPTPTSVPGVYTGSHVTPTSPIPTPTPNPNPNPNPNQSTTPTPPPPPPACMYKGRRYTTGQTWQDGCTYDCVCLDDMTGNYQCTDKCPNYPNLPLNCRMVYDPLNPCCKKPECPPPASPATPGPNGVTPTTVPTPPPAVCVYNGVAYRQGQTWNVGCDKVCVCEDAAMKRVNCDDRCPSFQSIPAGCQLTTDPQDSCCQALDCPVPPVGQPITPLPPAYVTGQSVPPQGPTPFTGRANDVCVYQGKTYNQGEKWQDGCTYTCVCMDAVAGRYMCTDRCPVYPNIPVSCTMIQDPNDSCCKKPFCPPTSAPPTTLIPPSPTQPGSPTQPPTPKPLPPDVCVYMGQSYKQGQQWYDGCTKVCRCDDASRNFYRCEDRCPKYNQVPQGCNMVPDPNDPVCCEKPECPVPLGPQPTQGFVGTLGPQPTPGSVTGVGKIPTPRPTPSVSPGSPTMTTLNPPLPKTGCYYDNKVYKQGDRWQSGCQYTCVCSDGITGRYSCDELCPPIPNNLPPECRAVQDPQQPCCGKVYCDTVNPTPQFPTPGVKPSQNPYVYTPATQPPSGGKSGYCVFQGVYYKQGQSWEDGCSKRCTCQDTMTGYYTCRERCPSFDSLPPMCKLITDPSDPCCLVPVCNTFPTPLPTGPNGVTLVSPDPNTNLIFTPAPAPPGSYVITGNGNSGMCVYNGKAYTSGQKWDVGCEYQCECIDAVRGQYKCTDRCPQYYDQIPQHCSMILSKTDSCCKEVSCDLRPNKNNTPVPSVVTVPPDMCVYTNNQKYAQGSTWTDGCSGTCQCVDSVSNNYICSQRCPVYNNLPSTCTLIPDPSDTCCKKPSCTGTLTPLVSSGRPTISPTLDPTVTNVFPLGTHTTITGSQKPSPGVPGYVTGMRSGCVYQNTLYKQGQTWNDGCDYVCACVDASQGFYRCTSKCPQLPPLPSYCAKRPIPGQCCPTVTCNLPNTGEYSPSHPELTPDLIPTPAPSSQPGQPTGEPVFVIGTGGSFSGTQPPSSNKCVAKDGREFSIGQSWTQGCDYNCTCLDGRSGYYECVPICPTYSKLPSSCSLEKVGCCDVPKCTDENGNKVDPLKSPDVYPIVSTISGGFTGFRPGYLSNINSYVGSSDPGCVYKGVVYKQGDKWDDGCDYSCECEDAVARRYKCISKCPRYTSIPAACQKVSDPQGGCCDIVTCPNTSPQQPSSATCKDEFNNCTLYGSAGTGGCVGQYEPWARAHCASTCGYCQSSCQDKIPDCSNYGKQACSGQYEPWAKLNCQAFCGFCQAPTPANPFCKDKLDNCANIAAFYCTGIYEDWARTNCNATCQLCGDTTYTVYPDTGGFGGQGTLGPTSGGYGENITGVSDPGWQLLLKGVGGAPGDLIAQWKGPGTVNALNPIARQLDNQLKENYKPSLPNYWDKCKFELVKLSVMTNGQENGYIIFNATGTDRLSWFDPSRIVNSSYGDLKGAQFDYFSLDGDANSGHRFVVTKSTSSCDMTGWIVMTTKSNCFYERGLNQPAYLYAAGGKAGQFGIDTREADIFVLQGYRGVCFHDPVNDVVTVGNVREPVCAYKGAKYQTGDTWQDNCDKTCTCLDANVNLFKCVDLCPTISKVPARCQIVTTPGECCGHLECLNQTSGCFYKGAFYGQDEKWEDGCDYNCQCVDASQGFYQCAAKCLTFRDLPSVCNLLPAPQGKCCPVVNCPVGIVVNYPDGYIPQ